MSCISPWQGFEDPGTYAFQDSISGPMIAASGVDFELAPHEGLVFLVGGGQQQVVHRVTHEVAEVRGEALEDKRMLDFDSDGFGYLYRDGGDDIEWLEDMFKLKVVKDKAGRQAIVQQSAGGHTTFAVWVDEYRLCADFGRLKLGILCGPQVANIKCMVFRMPKCQIRLFLDLYDFLRLLNLKAVADDKNPSHFVYKRFQRWCKFVHDDLGMPDQILKSAQYENSLAAEGGDVERQASAPHISMMATVALLVRWSSCSATAGGLKHQDDQDCALRCLRVFVSAGVGCKWELEVYLQVRGWHGGFADGEKRLVWRVDETGRLSFDSKPVAVRIQGVP